MTTQRNNRTAHQIDVKYRNEEGVGWVPQAWTRNEFSSSGRLLTTTKVDVLEAIFNAPVPAREFDLTFPPGTIVGNAKTGEVYRVRSDGSMQEFEPESGRELSTTISQNGGSWVWQNKWFVVASFAVGIALVAVYAKRRLYRRG
jgi:hypothetical protein